MKKVLSIAMFAAFFVGCSETPTNDTSVNKDATLSIVVADAVSGNIIENAEVSLIGVDKANSFKKADKGTVKYKVQAGTYTFKAKADGYAPLVCTADILPATAANIYQAINNTSFIELRKSTATVKGYAYYQDQTTMDNINKGAEGAEAEIVLDPVSGCRFENSVLKATVGKDGLYEFANVPEGIDGNISFTQLEKDDVLFSTSTTLPFTATRAGEVFLVTSSFIYNTSMVTNPAPTILNTSATVTSADATVEIKFDEAIDNDDTKTRITTAGYTIEGISGNTVKVTRDAGWTGTNSFTIYAYDKAPVKAQKYYYGTFTVNYEAP